MGIRALAEEKPLDALHTLLETARDLARALTDDPQIERLVQAFRMFPEGDRETILQVLEKEASWRSIVDRTDGATGIGARPNPHASLYVHVLNQAQGLEQRDADVIRRGLDTFVRMVPMLFQETVHAQWSAAAREIAAASPPESRELVARMAREVLALLSELEPR